MKIDDIASMGLIIILFISIVYAPLYFRSMKLVLDYMKDNLPDKWAELGSPTLIMNNSIRNTSSFLNFLLKRHYSDIDDGEFQVLSNRARNYLIMAISIVILFLFSSFLLIINS